MSQISKCYKVTVVGQPRKIRIRIRETLSFYCRVEAFPTLLRNIFFLLLQVFLSKKPGMYNFLTCASEENARLAYQWWQMVSLTQFIYNVYKVHRLIFWMLITRAKLRPSRTLQNTGKYCHKLQNTNNRSKMRGNCWDHQAFGRCNSNRSFIRAPPFIQFQHL